MPNFGFPHTFKDGTGEVASGAQVMEDLTVLKERIETLENAVLSATTIAGPYGALTVRAANTEYEPSATRPVLVTVLAACETASSFTIFVGGVEIGSGGSEGSSNETVSFIVPAGKKWKCTVVKVKELRSSYLPL